MQSGFVNPDCIVKPFGLFLFQRGFLHSPVFKHFVVLLGYLEVTMIDFTELGVCELLGRDLPTFFFGVDCPHSARGGRGATS